MDSQVSREAFGKVLQRFRKATGLTQSELAERSGLSRNGIADLERGARSFPRTETVELLSVALGLSADQGELLRTAARRPGGSTASSELPLPQFLDSAESTPFLGRSRQQEALAKYLARPGARILALSGPSGIGKTRLLKESAEMARRQGWAIAYARCNRWSHLELYSPFPGLLNPMDFLSEATRKNFPLLERFLGGSPAPHQEHWSTGQLDLERRRLFSEFARYLTHRSGRVGVLVLLDDLQWVGAEAVHLLEELSRIDARNRAKFVLSYRSTDLEDSHPLQQFLADRERESRLERIDLTPLSLEASRELLGGLVTGSLGATSGELDSILDRSQGNPLFLVRFAQQASQGGAAVPRGVEECLVQQYEALQTTSKPLLCLLSVSSHPLGVSDLTDAAGLLGVSAGAVSGCLSELMRRLLVREQAEGTFVVFHDLVKEVVLGRLGTAIVPVCHMALARTLETKLATNRPELLAWHFSQAGDIPSAFKYFDEAGRRAERFFAHDDAEAYLSSAYELKTGSPSQRASVAARLSLVLGYQDKYDKAIAVLDASLGELQEAGEIAGQAEVLAHWLRCCLHVDKVAEGIERGTRFLPVARTLKPSFGLGFFFASLAYLHYIAKDLPGQIELVRWMEPLVDQLTDPYGKLIVLEAKSLALTSQSRYRESNDVLLNQVLPFYEAMGDQHRRMVVLLNVAMSMNMLGDYSQVRSLLSKARPLVEAVQVRRPLGFALFLEANMKFETGDWNVESPATRSFLDVGREQDGDFGGELRVEIGRIKRLKGDVEGASQEFSIALRKRVLPSTYSLAPSVLEAEILLFHGDPPQAGKLLSVLEHEPWINFPAMHDWNAMYGLSQVWSGNLSQGTALLSRSVAGARTDSTLAALADALRYQAWAKLVAGAPGAAEGLAEAMQLDAQMGRQYALAKDWALAGLVAQEEEGVRLLEQARATLGRLGETILAPLIDRYLVLGRPGWREFFQKP